MGLLGSLVKSSIEGVVIELDKGNTPYVVGEEVISLSSLEVSFTVYLHCVVACINRIKSIYIYLNAINCLSARDMKHCT